MKCIYFWNRNKSSHKHPGLICSISQNLHRWTLIGLEVDLKRSYRTSDVGDKDYVSKTVYELKATHQFAQVIFPVQTKTLNCLHSRGLLEPSHSNSAQGWNISRPKCTKQSCIVMKGTYFDQLHGCRFFKICSHGAEAKKTYEKIQVSTTRGGEPRRIEQLYRLWEKSFRARGKMKALGDFRVRYMQRYATAEDAEFQHLIKLSKDTATR